MRFFGLFLVLAGIIGLCFILGAFSFFLQPWYLLAVLIIPLGGVFISYGAANCFKSISAFYGKGEGLSKDDYALFARIHASAKTYSIAAGFIAMIIGAVAVLAGGTPPSVQMFAKSLSPVLFGLAKGYFFNLPVSNYFAEKAR